MGVKALVAITSTCSKNKMDGYIKIPLGENLHDFIYFETKNS